MIAELSDLEQGNYFAHIHSLKEVENFLLIPEAIEKAIKKRIKEKNKRTGQTVSFDENILDLLQTISDDFKHRIQAQLQSHRLKFEKQESSN